MDVSVCIVSWNTKELLKDCIASIKTKTSGLQYEIIVVDNASSDGSAEMVVKEFPDCRLIESTTNSGFARANNRAAAEASSQYILYLNPDTRLVTNAVYGMFSFLEANEGVAAVGCKLVDEFGAIQYTCASTFPTAFNEFSALFFLNRLFPMSNVFSARELDYWNHEDSREVNCLSGACMMVRRSVVDELGGFDERLFMYAEDIDMCLRILRLGWKIYYLSSETIIHVECASSSKHKDRQFASIRPYASNYYFIKKNFGAIQAESFRFMVLLGSLFRLLVMTVSFPITLRRLGNDRENWGQVFRKHQTLLLWSLGLQKHSNLVRP